MEKQIKILDPYDNELNTLLWTTGRKKPKGVVQIIHGKSEHISRYREFAEYLNSLGLVVIGNDHLGHGESTDVKEYSHFADEMGFHKVYGGVQVVRDYIEEHYEGLPVIMFAHSMGSFVGRYAILYDYRRYSQAIFSGTGYFNLPRLRISKFFANVILKLKGPKHISKMFTNMGDGPVKSMKKNGIINHRKEWISQDREIQDHTVNCELCGKPLTIAAQRDVLQFMIETQNKKKIQESASSTPLYFISGDYDAFGDYGIASKKLHNLYKNYGYSNVTYTVVNNCRHEVINELNRQDTYKNLGDWIFRNINM